MKTQYIIEPPTSVHIGALMGMFIVPWLSMLCLGGIGHRLDIPYLFNFDYWTTVLIYLALAMVRGMSITRWKVTKGES